MKETAGPASCAIITAAHGATCLLTNLYKPRPPARPAAAKPFSPTKNDATQREDKKGERRAFRTMSILKVSTRPTSALPTQHIMSTHVGTTHARSGIPPKLHQKEGRREEQLCAHHTPHTPLQESIIALSKGEQLTADQAFQSVTEIMTGQATPAQTGAFLASLRWKKLTRTRVLAPQTTRVGTSNPTSVDPLNLRASPFPGCRCAPPMSSRPAPRCVLPRVS